ncbi:MAG: GYD domain-containing protein [Acidimicrobiales bacterium]
MGTYIMFLKWTERGAANISEAKHGREAGKKAAAAVGVTWKRSYLVMGEYDVIVVVEAPDDATMAKFILLGEMSGAVDIKTVRAFTEAEADELVDSLGELAQLVA